jgi:hypothetical protein
MSPFEDDWQRTQDFLQQQAQRWLRRLHQQVPEYPQQDFICRTWFIANGQRYETGLFRGHN